MTPTNKSGIIYMQIRVPQKIDYKGYPVYIRIFGHTFEFLVIFKNELYTLNHDIFPQLWRKIFHKLGFLKDAYTKKQLDAAIGFTIKSAQVTIDNLIEKQ